ncbi:hypothetical protein AAHE18_14G180600 [Arachis hypogaea]|nr:uncharacterized protein DS421_14g473820 [Arachis hypogaea]
MKAFTYVLIVLFIFSVGIENESLLKVSEAKKCKQIQNEGGCIKNTCNSDCRRVYGGRASGHCNAIEECVCYFPC